ncbi:MULTISPECIES: glutathione peroxidase [Rheinheimera]|uniref:glutathione peroxidase n=1 Tax=Rheinheimera TaxID=67575 RepID=UPI0010533018|nr:glutathione peroxidase [Rheinheimera sp. D18]QBL09045.1 glutathione peroxidase [Rheinheimera sp. D18]
MNEAINNVYEHSVNDAQGNKVSLSQYQGKVLLIVNTASQCGFTPQYKELEALHQTYHDKGLVILAFPCNQFGGQEPAADSDIQQFCEINFGVSFPVMSKILVNGPEAAPLFSYLKDQARGVLNTRAIKWNFTKFLINKQGQVIARYAPKTKPTSMSNAIAALL